MKDKYICPSCQKDIFLQKVADNYNLCYHCNSDLNIIQEVRNYVPTNDETIKSKKKSTEKIKNHNTDFKKTTSDKSYNGNSISIAGLFILLSGICILFSLLILSTVEVPPFGLLKFLGIVGVIFLCLGGVTLMNYKD